MGWERTHQTHQTHQGHGVRVNTTQLASPTKRAERRGVATPGIASAGGCYDLARLALILDVTNDSEGQAERLAIQEEGNGR